MPRTKDPTSATSATSMVSGVKGRRCRSCRRPFPASRLVAGDCPQCAGLIALPLRSHTGRFMPGLGETATRATTPPDSAPAGATTVTGGAA